MLYYGGFFSMEKQSELGGHFHDSKLMLKNARSCLNLILKELKIAKIHLPYFICDSVFEAITTNDVLYSFYSLNSDLTIKENIELQENELLLYINYFGLQGNYVDELYHRYGKQLIVDNVQAFFRKPTDDRLYFNSARKFFGVPGGAVLGGYLKPDKNFPIKLDEDLNHLTISFETNFAERYTAYCKCEANQNADIELVSAFSNNILQRIDYGQVIRKRRENYRLYQQAFNKINQFNFTLGKEVPFCYPLFLDQEINRDALYKLNIFVPKFWGEVLDRVDKGFHFEKLLTRNLLPLPLDQRFDKEGIAYVIENVKEIIS